MTSDIARDSSRLGVDETGDLEARLAQANLQPLWVGTAGYTPKAPQPPNGVGHWPGGEAFRLMREAASIVPGEKAARRVLVYTNPDLPAFGCTSSTMYACLQSLLPGEAAAAHRHPQSAFRFVLQGNGAETILNGHSFKIKRGDYIATPGWTWHGHANPTDMEAVWIDGLDSGILNVLNVNFVESPDEAEPITAGASGRRLNDGAYVDERWHVPYEAALAEIRQVHAKQPVDRYHGYRMRYLHPTTGEDIIPTTAAFLNLLPKGFSGATYQCTDSPIYIVLEGSGKTEIGSQVIEWGENDVFTIPSWMPFRHASMEGAILFSFSDRGAQERLGCWLEKADGVD